MFNGMTIVKAGLVFGGTVAIWLAGIIEGVEMMTMREKKQKKGSVK